jgi:hypothetical protein
MPYVLPKGSSKTGTSYASKPSANNREKEKRHGTRTIVKLPEPVKIPPPANSSTQPQR